METLPLNWPPLDSTANIELLEEDDSEGIPCDQEVANFLSCGGDMDLADRSQWLFSSPPVPSSPANIRSNREQPASEQSLPTRGPARADLRAESVVPQVVWHQTAEAVHLRVDFASHSDIRPGDLRLIQDTTSIRLSFDEIGKFPMTSN
jgi:hypothetical protein